jgi:hypothetical protein
MVCEVCGVGAFQLDHGQRLAVLQDGTIGLLAALLVLEFAGEVEAFLRIQRVAQHVYKEVAEKAFLVLLLLCCHGCWPEWRGRGNAW